MKISDIWRHRLIVAAILIFTATAASGATTDTAHFYTKHSYDVLKYKLDINLYQCFQTPFPKTFRAIEVITFRVDSTLNTISLNANNQSLAIDSVKMAGISFVHLANMLTITLDRTYQPGEIAEVKIYYNHKNVNDKGFYVTSGYVFTDSPPEGARKWLPCWDRPSDKATWELIAHVPLNVRLGSAGILADSVISGDTLAYHWICSDPVATYLITITSSIHFNKTTKYWHKLSNNADSIPVTLFYKTGENLKVIDSIITPLTNFFSEKFGDYPFEKIGFATLNGSFPWGGMENQSMVNLMPGGYNDGNLIAHEHSHQWFGDLLTCGTWADIWLNEGFGTYCQNLWVEHAEGYDAYLTSIRAAADNYLGHNPGWPLYHPEWAIHTPTGNTLYNQAITYDKGACVLFQLRYVLGDSLFFKLMHDYATDPAFMYGNVFTEDFVAKTNQVAQENMNWFFDEWVYAPNHPVYQNTFEIDTLNDQTWRLSFVVTQTQTNTTFFQMPLQFKVTFADESDTIITVRNDINHQEYGFDFSKQPMNLVFDPFRNILLKQAATIYKVNSLPLRTGFKLHQNEPNPFTNLTMVSYAVSSESNVTISVLDSNGKQVSCPVNRIHTPGVYRFEYQNLGTKPGVYFLTMQAGNFTETRKMIVGK